jgi:glutamyl-tRNA synthetase
MLKLIELVRPRAHRLGDFVEIARPLLSDVLDFDSAAVHKHLSSPDLISHLDALRNEWSRLESFDEGSLEKVLRDLAGSRGVKAGTLIHAVRVAVTGRAVSPGLFEVLALLGRAKSVARLDDARERIR